MNELTNERVKEKRREFYDLRRRCDNSDALNGRTSLSASLTPALLSLTRSPPDTCTAQRRCTWLSPQTMTHRRRRWLSVSRPGRRRSLAGSGCQHCSPAACNTAAAVAADRVRSLLLRSKPTPAPSRLPVARAAGAPPTAAGGWGSRAATAAAAASRRVAASARAVDGHIAPDRNSRMIMVSVCVRRWRHWPKPIRCQATD